MDAWSVVLQMRVEARGLVVIALSPASHVESSRAILARLVGTSGIIRSSTKVPEHKLHFRRAAVPHSRSFTFPQACAGLIRRPQRN